MIKSKKVYLAWVGQNATFGTPNRVTGNLSMCGELKAFSTRKLRRDFVDNYYNHSNPSVSCYSVSKKQARQHFLGTTMEQYNEILMMLEVDNI